MSQKYGKITRFETPEMTDFSHKPSALTTHANLTTAIYLYYAHSEAAQWI